MKRWFVIPAAAIAAFLATDATNASAAADTEYSYPYSSYGGSTCTPQYAAVTTWLRSGWGYNTSATSSTTVSCPVTRRNPDSSKGITFSVMYVSNPSGATTTCTLMEFDVANNLIQSSTKSVSYAGFQALYFDALTTSPTWGNYSIVCTVPPHGFLNDYFIAEGFM